MKNYVIAVALFLVGLFVSNWIFNHIYAWAGVAAYILTISLTVNFFINQLNSKKQ